MEYRTTLEESIGRIRKKLRIELLFWGGGPLLAALLVVSLLAVGILTTQNFSSLSIFWVRLFAVLSLGILLWGFVLRPLVRPPSLLQIASFLEERAPELEQRVSTAMEVMASRSRTNPELADLIRSDALKHFKGLPQPRFYWPRALAGSAGIMLLSLLTGGGLFFAGPVEYRHGLSLLLGGGSDETGTALYRLLVDPGSTRIPKRADLLVHALPLGFDPVSLNLRVRYLGEGGWETVAMVPDIQRGGATYLLYDLRDPVDYYVEAEGIRSEVFHVEIIDAPRTESVVLHLDFPDYTGLPDVTVSDETLIRAVKGTRVRVEVKTDRPAAAALLRFENRTEVQLSPQGGQAFEATFEILADDYFRVFASDQEGILNPASDEFTIEALDDLAPTVRFTFPGRDKTVTLLEEVLVEVTAEDDFSIERLELVYSVNGGSEKVEPFRLPRGTRKAASSHTFLLEDFGLQPGDIVSYFARANDSVSQSGSDIYFLEVRPFEREFRQSQIMGGNGQAGEGGLEFSRRQKQIVVGTFSLTSEKDRIEPAEVSENSQTLALVQQRLQSEVQAVVDRFDRRGMNQIDPRFEKMKEALQTAIGHMKPAEAALNAINPQGALPEAQKALQQLLRAESLFTEVQVSLAAGSGEGSASPEDLADLVDLELDRTKNQYETLQSTAEEKVDQAIDEALEKLKELARRQEAEIERTRQKGLSGNAAGRSSVREMAAELERMARELARLSRRKDEPQLSRLSEELNRAAREMKESQTSGQGMSRSLELAQQSLERLRRAQQSLAGERRSEMEQRLEELASQAEALHREQEEIVEGLGTVTPPKAGERPSQEYFKQVRELFWKKQSLEEGLQTLEGELHQTARRVQSSEPQAAKQLRESALGIREDRLPEKMREGTELIAGGLISLAQHREEGIAGELAELRDRIRAAGQALGAQGHDPDERLRQALESTGTLLENLDSLHERVEGDAAGSQSGEDRLADGDREDKDPASLTARAEPQPGVEGPIPSPGINPSTVRREWEQRINEAVKIQGQLGNTGTDTGRAVERLVKQMRALDAEKILDDPGELRRLRSTIIDGFHQLELSLRRMLNDTDRDFLRPVDQDSVPAEYRERVEEYYRRLASRQSLPR